MDTRALYDALSGDLRRWLSGRVEAAAVDDLHQEIFLRLHRGLPGLREPDRVLAWAWQVARNAVRDHWRTRRPSEPLPDDLATPAHGPPDPNEQVASWLPALVEALPDTYREAVRLSELEGLSQAEVGRRLGLSPSGARTRVQRGRRLLREALERCCAIEREGDQVIDWRRREDASCCG